MKMLESKLYLSSVVKYFDQFGSENVIERSKDRGCDLDYGFLVIIDKNVGLDKLNFLQEGESHGFVALDKDGVSVLDSVECILWYTNIHIDEHGEFIDVDSIKNGSLYLERAEEFCTEEVLEVMLGFQKG